MRLLFSAFWIGLALLLFTRRAQAAERPTAFALVVTNNRSLRLSRPDLRYADDDGAKYYETFRMVMPEANVALLTTFDRDTAKLFPGLVPVAKEPSKAEVSRVVRDFSARVAAARREGPVDFYFVFAGHGDIENGKGFLELSDGPFTSDDLEGLLRSIPATRAHVILDSCNSFFVINARKPGGRHFVTSTEATQSLSDRLPNVGVFLSTSAEAEVFEWSELQSGVFSHAVISGLSGAADANGDGEVSYDELRAFVNTSSTTIRNPLYRPQVFARAPLDRGGEAIFRLAGADATRIRLDAAEHRVTVRDKDEIPWVDAHKEAGVALSLYVPKRVATGATVDEKSSDGHALLARRALSTTDASDEVLLAALAPAEASPSPTDARGPDQMFAALYSRPFGPQSFAAYEAERRAEPPMVLGVASDDKLRIHNLLEQAADRARVERYTNAFLYAGVGAMFAGVGFNAYGESSGTASRVAWATFGGVAAAGGAAGVIYSLLPSSEEKLLGRYSRGLRDGEAGSMRLTLDMENDIFSLARAERRRRTALRYVDLGAAVLFGTTAVANGFQYPKDPPSTYVLYGAAVLGFGSLFGLSFIKSPAEQMADSWAKDPSLQSLPSDRPHFTIRPNVGLGSVGVSGTF